MRPLLSMRMAMVAAGVAALTIAVVLDRIAPPPAADVALGTESCFGTGLFGRELPAPLRVPQRWTTERAVFRFRDLPPGPLQVRVEIHGQRSPVAVAVQGRVAGVIPSGSRAGEWTTTSVAGETLEVELRVEPFVAWGGRRLGALVDRVVVVHGPAGMPPLSILLGFLAPAVAMVVLGGAAGLSPVVACSLAMGTSLLQAFALFPAGLLRSDYAPTLALMLSATSFLALAVARAFERWRPGASRWAFAALLVAGLVQGIAAHSPVMVVSDAEFHANKLAAVARGDFFPTSLTPGKHPFRFPYGVSFYALLAPLAQAGVDRLSLVTWGGALAGVGASAALFGILVPWGARRAGLATLLLQILPVTFDLYSYGNVSNIFGQAATVWFFAWWWAMPAVGSAFIGAVLLAMACLSHFSSLIVLAFVCAAVVVLEGRGLLADHRRGMAVLVGLLVAALYYAHFLPLVLDQIPRLAETGPGPRPWLASALRQGRSALEAWGLPALILATVGVFRGGPPALRRGLLAWGLSGALLAMAAALSPLEVRYLYALTFPLVVAAAEGLEGLLARGRVGTGVAVLLVLWQAFLAAAGIVEGVLHRYRA